MKHIVCCTAVTALALLATAQAQMSKPGLWEYTSNMKMEGMPQPQIPPDQLAKMQAMGIKIPGMGGQPTKVKMCMTKEMVEKNGGTAPQRDPGCHMDNIQKSVGGMKADLVCSGQNFNGTGSVEGTRTDENHGQGHMHFKGTGKGGRPIEWTMDSTSTYLGPDCGDVKPGQPVLE